MEEITEPITALPEPDVPLISSRAAILVALTAVAVIALWMIGTPEGIVGKAVAVGFAICHRIAERSFQIEGLPLPLCARCTGIYLGVITGYLIAIARGRLRAGGLPRRGIIAPLIGFGIVMGIDGLNSYIQLFPGTYGVYPASNVLRLVTGMYCGIAIIHLMLPVFNSAVWREPLRIRILDGWRDLLGVCLIGALMIALVLSERPLFLLVLGVASAFGALLVLTMVGTVLFLSFSRRAVSARNWRDLAIPALAGLTMALIQVGAIDILRFALTHTWDGFRIG
jgi:uncharacterized membrane protein